MRCNRSLLLALCGHVVLLQFVSFDFSAFGRYSSLRLSRHMWREMCGTGDVQPEELKKNLVLDGKMFHSKE
jgi:hypothetical protein